MKVTEIGVPYEYTVTSSAGDGGDKTVDFRPDANTIWIVEFAALLHNDDVNRDTRWAFYNGTTTVYRAASGAIAASAYNNLLDANMPGPIILTRSHYARALVLSLAAPHTATIYARVRVIKGVETEA